MNILLPLLIFLTPVPVQDDFAPTKQPLVTCAMNEVPYEFQCSYVGGPPITAA